MNKYTKIFKQINEAEDRGNIKKCIDLCQKGIESVSTSEFEIWFKFRFNLARLLNEQGNNFNKNNEKAIKICMELLRNISKKRYPLKWANTNMLLGNVYESRNQGNKNQNLKKAITCYKKAESIFTRRKYPVDWALIQEGTGTLYSEISSGRKVNNVQNATICFLNSLKVYNKSKYPEQTRDVLGHLVHIRDRLIKLNGSKNHSNSKNQNLIKKINDVILKLW